MDITTEIRDSLFAMQDEKYRDFQRNLIPGEAADSMIGVRTPALRKMAGELIGRKDCEIFLRDVPHRYFEENQLHAFIISLENDYEKCLEQLERFLPYVNNWATCDQMSPQVFKKNPERLLPEIARWIASAHTYTIRFGIGMLMRHFLKEHFRAEYVEMVATIRSSEYYVNMMIAWYFATALAEQYETVLPYLENRRLSIWTHNKAIQKAMESYRIMPEQKTVLRTLKIKKPSNSKTEKSSLAMQKNSRATQKRKK